jgi:hypothetical protein
MDHLSGKARRAANMKIIDADKPAIRPGLKYWKGNVRE